MAKKKGSGNALISSLIDKQKKDFENLQNLVDNGKSLEKEIIKPETPLADTLEKTSGKASGEKNKADKKEDKKTIVKADKSTKDKNQEEVEVAIEDVETTRLEYEQFFKASEKYETEKLESVYVYTPIHRKLKNLVVAENKKGLNMTVLLSNIVDDFFSTHESEIKKSLKKLTQI